MRANFYKAMKTINKDIKYFKNFEELSSYTADFIIKLIHRILKEKDRVTLVLAGGDTPRRSYELLAEKSKLRKLPWEKIHIFWGDERYVSKDDQHSNYLMAKESLLSKINIPDENIHIINTDYDSEQEAAMNYERELKFFFLYEEPIFDIFLLGIGVDGHIASLFPDDPDIDKDKVWVKGVSAPKIQPFVSRITLTLPIINNARNILFLAKGERKRKVIKHIISNGEQEKIKFPAGKIKALNGNIYWLIV